MSKGASTTGASILGCEIFAAGTHRGDYYSIADLDNMVRNFYAARDSLDPPMVAGHEEEQPLVDKPGFSFLDNTGIPAVGWVSRLYREGTKLFADFNGVLPKIAKLIKARLFKKVSSEVYDNPPEGVPATCQGKMLRRVAILGGEIPQIKSLADLPLPEEFCETASSIKGWRLKIGTATVQKHSGYVRFYSEAQPMDRKAVEDQLRAVGYSDTTIQALSPLSDADFQVFALAALADEATEGGADAATDGSTGDTGTTATTDMAGPMDPTKDPMKCGDVTPEQMKADLVAMGVDQASLDSLSPEDLMKLWQEKKGAPMAEPTKPATGAQTVAAPQHTPTAPSIPGLPAGQTPQSVTLKFAEDMRRLKAEMDAAKKMSEQRLATEKKATIKAFCDRMVQAGKVLPAQLHADAKQPGKSLLERLERADAVKKFSDGKTELDLQMAEIEAGPKLIEFSERFKSGKPGAGASSLDSEVASVQAYAERHAEDFKKLGTNVKTFCETFKKARERGHEITAAEYCGSAAIAG